MNQINIVNKFLFLNNPSLEFEVSILKEFKGMFFTFIPQCKLIIKKSSYKGFLSVICLKRHSVEGQIIIVLRHNGKIVDCLSFQKLLKELKEKRIEKAFLWWCDNPGNPKKGLRGQK